MRYAHGDKFFQLKMLQDFCRSVCNRPAANAFCMSNVQSAMCKLISAHRMDFSLILNKWKKNNRMCCSATLSIKLISVCHLDCEFGLRRNSEFFWIRQHHDLKLNVLDETFDSWWREILKVNGVILESLKLNYCVRRKDFPWVNQGGSLVIWEMESSAKGTWLSNLLRDLKELSSEGETHIKLSAGQSLMNFDYSK